MLCSPEAQRTAASSKDQRLRPPTDAATTTFFFTTNNNHNSQPQSQPQPLLRENEPGSRGGRPFDSAEAIRGGHESQAIREVDG